MALSRNNHETISDREALTKIDDEFWAILWHPCNAVDHRKLPRVFRRVEDLLRAMRS